MADNNMLLGLFIGVIFIIILISIISITLFFTMNFRNSDNDEFNSSLPNISKNPAQMTNKSIDNQTTGQGRIQTDQYTTDQTTTANATEQTTDQVTTVASEQNTMDLLSGLDRDLSETDPTPILGYEFIIKEIKALDVLAYSEDKTYILKYNGNVELNNEEIKSNIKFSKIFVFNGHICALGKNGYLYVIQEMNKVWLCNKCDWCHIKDIKHISVTLDEEHIWIQNSVEGMLFNNEFRSIEHIEISLKNHYRVYGKNKNVFEKVDSKTHKSAALDYNGVLHTSKTANLIRFINWEPVWLV